MTDMIASRFYADDIRSRYTALQEVSSSLEQFRRDTIRNYRTNVDAGILDVGEAHAPNLDAFVEYMIESYNRLETSILESCYGTENEPTDGEPYWRIRAYYTAMEGEWYFRSEIDALEWTKYLNAKDPELDIDVPRFFGEG